MKKYQLVCTGLFTFLVWWVCKKEKKKKMKSETALKGEKISLKIQYALILLNREIFLLLNMNFSLSNVLMETKKSKYSTT